MVMGALFLDEIRKAQIADEPARILVIGTADPPNQVPQAEYLDYYFHLTNNHPSCSKGAIEGHLTEVGLNFHLLKTVPGIISKNIEKCLEEAHPGGPAILYHIEIKLGLKAEKMKVTRHVLSGYGNMSSACVFFILDEMRRKAVEDGAETTAEGLEWGVLFGFGPGLTVETVVLHSIPLLPSPYVCSS
ncbi:hypothetical protein BRARA_B03449 [Brassica rapa]|uniref:Chalcone/stilbene synthase C-terminal domain-containing protein n=1 Tax=Brassica campestris TaxID=3711 RepID=A0A398ALM2_BRACM|nr:hypothetical protein BRARA_B03449 [Brassica rapa]